MNVEYANIFINSAVRVFQQEIKLNLTRKDLVKKDSPVPSMPISIIIGITGFIHGQVVYSMDRSFAYGVAHAMLPNKLPVDLKKLENSAISEIANIITGQASIVLAGADKIINLTPPVVIMASDLTIDFLEIPTIALSLICEIGTLEINIAFIEGKAR